MIAVIGAAGTIGRNVARFLESWDVPFARRDARLEGDERVDATDAGAVAAALDGCTVCVNCADYRLNVPIMRGALSAGAHYVDLGGLYHVTRLQLELDGQFRERGKGALLGMGSAPGKTNLLASAAVSRLEGDPKAMEIWAATRDPAAEGHPFPAPYSVRTLLDELSMSPVIVEDGELTEVEPLSGQTVRRLADPVGPATGIYTLHSELATLPSAYPTLERASFRLCLSPGLLEKLLALGDDEEPEPYEQSEASVAVHLVDVEADSGRRVVGWTLTRGGSARSTSEPAARAAVELLGGRMPLVGAKAPEAAIPDPEAFLALLDTEVYWDVA
jgi:saccharopine dehydrogenase-like NADP-dependent oxidoreductase